jgi:hypothetical protein
MTGHGTPRIFEGTDDEHGEERRHKHNVAAISEYFLISLVYWAFAVQFFEHHAVPPVDVR